jgi:hypothetical protein
MSIFWEVGFANTVFPDSELQVVLLFRSELRETYHHIISFTFKAAVLLKFGRITWWIDGLDTVSLVPKLIHVTSGPT